MREPYYEIRMEWKKQENIVCDKLYGDDGKFAVFQRHNTEKNLWMSDL